MRLLMIAILLSTSVPPLLASEAPQKPSKKDIRSAIELAVKHYDNPDFLKGQKRLLEKQAETNNQQLTITQLALTAISIQTKEFLQTQVDLKDHILSPGHPPRRSNL